MNKGWSGNRNDILTLSMPYQSLNQYLIYTYIFIRRKTRLKNTEMYLKDSQFDLFEDAWSYDGSE